MMDIICLIEKPVRLWMLLWPHVAAIKYSACDSLIKIVQGMLNSIAALFTPTLPLPTVSNAFAMDSLLHWHSFFGHSLTK